LTLARGLPRIPVVVSKRRGGVIRFLMVAAIVTALMAGIMAGASCTEDGEGQPQATMEEEILALVNEARASGGLGALARVDALDDLALAHSRDMSRTGTLSHDGFDDRAASIQRSLSASSVGENVAVGYQNAGAFVDGWLGSPGHRANIMSSSYRRTGIGCCDGYATQIFCD
jgi:uncharacterized protein YkwD